MYKNISIRKIDSKDLDDYFEWINNRTLVEFNSQFSPVSKEQHLEWFKEISMKKDLVTFSIIKDKKELIGSCSLRNIDFKNKVGELQIRIGKMDYHNKGYGTKAIWLLIKYGFNDLLLNKVYLHVFEDNIRAIKAYENCNFAIEKLVKNFSIINGIKKNAYLMSIYKDKFIEIKEK